MDRDEIAQVLALSERARRSRRGAWPLFSLDASRFDAKLRMRRPPVTPDPKADRGPWVMPKVFRRQSTWWMNRKATMVDGTFVAFLRGKPDYCFDREELLTHGESSATLRRLDELVDAKGRCRFSPGDVVFREGASTLIGPKGRTVAGW